MDNAIYFEQAKWASENNGPAPDGCQRESVHLSKFGEKQDNPDHIAFCIKSLSKQRHITIYAEDALEQASGLSEFLKSLHDSGFHTALVADFSKYDLFSMGEITEKILESADIIVVRPTESTEKLSSIPSSMFSAESIYRYSIVFDIAAGRESGVYEGHYAEDIEWLALSEYDKLVYVLSEQAQMSPVQMIFEGASGMVAL